MAWLRGWMGDSSCGRNPGSGAGMTRVTYYDFGKALTTTRLDCSRNFARIELSCGPHLGRVDCASW